MNDESKASVYWSDLAASYRSAHHEGLRGWLRRRELAAIVELLALRPGESVLDAGCGAGVTTEPLLGADRRVVAVDLSPAMVARAGELPNVDVRVADVETMRLGQTFDKILCAGVLELIRDPSRALDTLARHLRPSGRLVVCSPGPFALGAAFTFYHLSQGNRIYRRSLQELRGHVEAAGLNVLNTRRAGLLWHIAAEHRA